MTELTFEERNLVCIYSGGGTRLGTIAALEEMRRYLEPDETELLGLTDSALGKLRGMDDAAFSALDLIPDFGPEDAAYGRTTPQDRSQAAIRSGRLFYPPLAVSINTPSRSS